MKHVILITAFSFCFIGCNMNPNKEARIQKLETELNQAKDDVEALETKVNALEEKHEEISERVSELQNQ